MLGELYGTCAGRSACLGFPSGPLGDTYSVETIELDGISEKDESGKGTDHRIHPQVTTWNVLRVNIAMKQIGI